MESPQITRIHLRLNKNRRHTYQQHALTHSKRAPETVLIIINKMDLSQFRCKILRVPFIVHQLRYYIA